MDATHVPASHAPASNHAALQEAAWRALWRILLRPLPDGEAPAADTPTPPEATP